MNELDLIEVLKILGPHGATLVVLAGLWIKFAKNGSHTAPCGDLRETRAEAAADRKNNEINREKIDRMSDTLSRVDERTEQMKEKIDSIGP
jgi:hypothetical protein